MNVITSKSEKIRALRIVANAVYIVHEVLLERGYIPYRSKGIDVCIEFDDFLKFVLTLEYEEIDNALSTTYRKDDEYIYVHSTVGQFNIAQVRALAVLLGTNDPIDTYILSWNSLSATDIHLLKDANNGHIVKSFLFNNLCVNPYTCHISPRIELIPNDDVTELLANIAYKDRTVFPMISSEDQLIQLYGYDEHIGWVIREIGYDHTITYRRIVKGTLISHKNRPL